MGVFWIGNVDWTGRKVLYRLTQNLDALAHFFDADQITIVRVTHRPDRYIKVILFVVEIRLCLAYIVIDPATPNVRSSDSVVDGIFFRDHTQVLRAIYKDRIPGQQPIDFVKLRRGIRPEICLRREETSLEVPRLCTVTRIKGT